MFTCEHYFEICWLEFFNGARVKEQTTSCCCLEKLMRISGSWAVEDLFLIFHYIFRLNIIDMNVCDYVNNIKQSLKVIGIDCFFDIAQC